MVEVLGAMMSPFVTLRKSKSAALLLLVAFTVVLWMAWILPKLLVLNNAEPSDYIVVLDGHDNNYFTGLKLLQNGFGRRMFVCLDIPDVPLEGDELNKDREFIRQTAGRLAENIELCRNGDEDIFDAIHSQLIHTDARRILVVSPEAQSRAQYVAARRRMPQYTWSVSPSKDPTFNVHWWRRRLWTKTFVDAVLDLSTALQIRTAESQRAQRSAK